MKSELRIQKDEDDDADYRPVLKGIITPVVTMMAGR